MTPPSPPLPNPVDGLRRAAVLIFIGDCPLCGHVDKSLKSDL